MRRNRDKVPTITPAMFSSILRPPAPAVLMRAPLLHTAPPNSGRARLQRRCMGGGQSYGKVSVVAACAACSVHYGSISKLTDYFYNFRTKYLSCHHCLVLWILMVYYRLLRRQIWRAWSKHSTLGLRLKLLSKQSILISLPEDRPVTKNLDPPKMDPPGPDYLDPHGTNISGIGWNFILLHIE